MAMMTINYYYSHLIIFLACPAWPSFSRYCLQWRSNRVCKACSARWPIEPAWGKVFPLKSLHTGPLTLLRHWLFLF